MGDFTTNEWSLDKIFSCHFCYRANRIRVECTDSEIPNFIEWSLSAEDLELYQDPQAPRGVFYPECYPEGDFDKNGIKKHLILPVLMNPGSPIEAELLLFNEIRKLTDSLAKSRDRASTLKKYYEKLVDLYKFGLRLYDLGEQIPGRRFRFHAGVNLYLNIITGINQGKGINEDRITKAFSQMISYRQSQPISSLDSYLTSNNGLKTLGLTQLVKCTTQGNPNDYVQRICFERHLRNELVLCQPKIILCFGGLVFDFFERYPQYDRVQLHHPTSFKYLPNSLENPKAKNCLECIIEQLKIYQSKL